MQSNGEVGVLRRYIQNLDRPVVFDVGANRGDWIAVALGINPAAQVHAFEPASETFSLLRGRRFPANVVLNPVGVSDERRTVVLNVYGSAAGTNSLFARAEGESVSRETVETVSLTQYCDERGIGRVDFLKIDVEGGEFGVLKGAAELMRQSRVRAVQFEYGEGWIAARVFLRDVLDWIDEHGSYDVFKLTPYGMRQVARYHWQLDNFHNANYVLVCKAPLAGERAVAAGSARLTA